jgi:hypothetical protein
MRARNAVSGGRRDRYRTTLRSTATILHARRSLIWNPIRS